MLLAGDVGGTHTRLGLFTESGVRPAAASVRTYASGAFDTVEDLLARFLADACCEPAAINAAALGVAGPVRDQAARLTNVSWRVSARDIGRRFGFPSVRLLNDLEAMAYAIPVLTDDELVTLQAGAPDARGNAALVAPGTGLGEACLHRVGDRLIPMPSEGGHADFAARTPREIELLQFVSREFGRADYERVLSGPGLVLLHRFTHGASPCSSADLAAPDAPARITASAIEHRCASCVEALDLFVALLGAEAGNIGLRAMSTAGVYIGGGIPPKILPALRGETFLNAFRSKHPLHELAAAIPVRVIVCPDPGLLGAAVAAAL